MRESEIQEAAIRIVELEFRGLEAQASDLDDLKNHTATCHRCAELLDGFLTIEREFRREMGGWEGATWIRLLEIEDAAGSCYPDEEAEEEPFRLAADTPQLTTPSAFEALGPRLFQSEDGAIEVALQPAAEKGGILATLTRGWQDQRSARQHFPGTEVSRPRKLGLACGLGIHWFDDNHRASLPSACTRSLFFVVL